MSTIGEEYVNPLRTLCLIKSLSQAQNWGILEQHAFGRAAPTWWAGGIQDRDVILSNAVNSALNIYHLHRCSVNVCWMSKWRKGEGVTVLTGSKACWVSWDLKEIISFFLPQEKLTVGKRKRNEDDEVPVGVEMAENTDNPLRCPVRLYEFYLSKW